MLSTGRLTRGDVLQRVGELFQAPPGDPVAPGRVGVEVEWIAARPGAGRPEPVGVPELTALLGVDPHLVDQARLTFEPGGQLEISPAPADTAAAALEQVGEFSARLSRVLAGSGVELFSSGVNPWHGVDELGLQTPGPRYSAMQAHFDSIGEWGRGMMRQTAALQICIDLGGERTGLDRWRLTNLAGPALSATFANSPVREERITGMQSTRSRIWQGVEAARTGFDGTLVGGDVDQSVERYTAFAMAAPLIPLLTDADDPPPHAPFGEMM